MEATSNCIKCSKTALIYGGYVIADNKPIIAGWCSEECYNAMESDEYGCYGKYDNVKMGKLKNIY